MDKACVDYEDLKFWVNGIKIIVTGFMTGCNVISKYLIMWMISVLGFQKKTTEAQMNFIYLFVITTFQSILIIFLLNAKLDFVPYIGDYFKDGKMRDFTWDWYKEIGGVFILRMIIMSINPLTQIVAPGWIKKAKIWWFEHAFIGFRKKKSMWEYYKLLLGNVFLLETNMYRLAGVTLLAFLFGAGIPILFIFALLYVVLNEMCLRYQLAYHFKKPFNYSNKLNDMFLRYCATLPIIYSGFGLWMYSNRQIFDNTVLPKDRTNGLVDH